MSQQDDKLAPLDAGGDDQAPAVTDTAAPSGPDRTAHGLRGAAERIFGSETWKNFFLPLVFGGAGLFGLNYLLKDIDYRDKVYTAAAQARVEVIRQSHERIRKDIVTLLGHQAVIEAMIAAKASNKPDSLADEARKDIKAALRALEIELRQLEHVDSELADPDDMKLFAERRAGAAKLVRELHLCVNAGVNQQIEACSAVHKSHYPPREGGGTGLALNHLLDAASALLRLLPTRR